MISKIARFASIKNVARFTSNKEYISYDVDNIFTNIPLKETVDYILEEIYVNKKIKTSCSKLVFKRFLYKLTTEYIFQFNTKFFKQIYGCSMGIPLSITIADIHMTRTESVVV